jgi:hypothetical protein
VAEAVLQALDPERQTVFRANLERLANQHTWEAVAQPLGVWCQNPVKIGRHGEDPRDRYVHDLERNYSETAEYARHLERTIAERDQTIDSLRLTLGNVVHAAARRLRRMISRVG